MKRIVLLLMIASITSSSKLKQYCDIKGNVNNPGVYEINNGDTIQDIINLSGGLKKNSYTDNINLSKKVKDEMVIYIFSNSEISKIKELSNCVCEDTYVYKECEEDKKLGNEENNSKFEDNVTTTNDIITEPNTTIKSSTTTKIIKTTEKINITTKTNYPININLASIEELLNIKGLGEKKASSIIKYREEHGNFESIEDIKKVDGIGDKLFESIKEFITV